MYTLLQDLRFAVRTLLKSPGFAAVAIVTLAVGIGATTIMFAIVNAVLIRPLDYPQAEQVVHLSEAFQRRPGMSIAYANFLDWRAMNRVFSSMAAIQPHALTLSGSSAAQPLDGRRVSYEFLSTLGIKPMLGRDFAPRSEEHTSEL